MNRSFDIAVIGGGPAGLAAALEAHAAAPEKSVVIIERDKELGGILQQCIHNGFGLHFFGEELTGPEYAGRFIEKLRGTGIEVLTDSMVLNLSADKKILAVSAAEGLIEIQAGAVILAMGCRERTRGALNIPGTRPAGVYTAGCAQRLVNMEGYMPGRRAVILGSGDIGLIMARRLTWEGAKVEAVVELMPYSSGLNRNIVQCLTDNDIPLYFNHTVTRVIGRERVEGVEVAEVDPATRRPIPGTEITYDCDTLLLSVGLIPENELSQGAGVKLSPLTQGAEVDDTLQTSVPGVFACGNVLHVHDLVDHVSNESFRAGHAAAAYARGQLAEGETLRVMDGEGVRGTVPQRIRKGASQPVDLMFRPSGVFRKASCVVECNGREIARKKAPIFTPGEMAVVTLKPETVASLDGDVTVRIERSEA